MAVNFQHTSELKIHKWIVCSAALNRSPAALQLLPVRAHAGATIAAARVFARKYTQPMHQRVLLAAVHSKAGLLKNTFLKIPGGLPASSTVYIKRWRRADCAISNSWAWEVPL
jgi:hypothetical protein